MPHIAVTGTKGKSTVTRIVQHILMSKGHSVFGEYGNDGSFVDGKRDFQFRSADQYFSRKEAKDADFIVSEATSYVLGLDVYDDFPIDVGVFTGFEELEHTELYESADLYMADKKKIFGRLAPEGVVFVNRDSHYYDKIVDSVKQKYITFGEHEDSDVLVKNISVSMGKTSFDLIDQEKNAYSITSCLYGVFNVMNIVAAFLACKELGLNPDHILSGIDSFPGLKGRNNVYHIVDTNTIVVIDYAHTSDSLKYQLEFLKENKGTRKLISLFGCGGNKTPEKRPEMGAVAAKFCDYIILTNDNPRDEDPRQIIHDILTGIDSLSSIEVILDREEAIKRTLSNFHNSLLLIAGKGNEHETEILGTFIPSNDFNTINNWLMQNSYSVRGYFDYLD